MRRSFSFLCWCLLLAGMLGPQVAVAQVNQPNWRVNPADYEQSMSVTVALLVDGARATALTDTVAAFAEGVLRGVAGPTDTGDGTLVYFLTVYGEAASERMTFQIYDSANDSVRAVGESLPFQRDAVIGSVSAPVFLTVGDGPDLSDPNGWTVDPANYASSMNVVAALYLDGTRAHAAGDSVAAFVGEEVRGVASLTDFEGEGLFLLTVHGNLNGETVTFKAYDSATQTVKTIGQTLPFFRDDLRGLPSNPYIFQAGRAGGTTNTEEWTVTPADFGKTMNFVGALYLDAERSVNPADSVAAFVAGEVRGVGTAQLRDGALLFMLTLYGDNEGETINFKVWDETQGVVRDVKQTIAFKANTVRGSLSSPVRLDANTGFTPAWTINPDDFSKQMTVVGSLVIDGTTTTEGNNLVAAFVGEEVRGVATLVNDAGKGNGASLNEQTFLMSVFSNDDGEEVAFRAYNEDLGEQVTDQTVGFQENAVLGSPSEPLPWNVSSPPLVRVQVRAFLEGPYDVTVATMSTHLKAAGRLPTTQPYQGASFVGTSSAYQGGETLAPLPSTMVDWVLVELRTGTAARTKVASRAAILHGDGLVTDIDGVSPIRFEVEVGSYHVVLRHRNHLAVMSAAPVALTATSVTYDFTTDAGQAFGANALKEIEPGVFGLYAGDGNASDGTSASDQALWLQFNGFDGYYGSDYNLSGGVSASDQAAWLRNNGRDSQVPKE